MEQKNQITNIMQLEVKWLSDIEGTEYEDVCFLSAECFLFNDGTILGKIDYPFTIVVGKYIKNLGIAVMILDEELGGLPLIVCAAPLEEGKSNHYYGLIEEYVSDNKHTTKCIAVVAVNIVDKFELESISDVSKKISYGIELINNEESINKQLYYSMISENSLNIVIPNINQTKEGLEYFDEFKRLDSIEFDFDDSEDE